MVRRWCLRLAFLVALLMIAGVPGARAAGVGCAWPLESNPDSGNVFFPDTAATYWVAPFVPAPGAELLIRGRYPYARYFSFHVYDAATRILDAITDFQIQPDPGSSNPFQIGVQSKRRRYTVRVVFANRPAEPSPNTIYAGSTREGVPNPEGALIYRVYVPIDPQSASGGEPLPSVTLEEHGTHASVRLGRCPALPPSTGGLINETLNAQNFPAAAPTPVNFPSAQDPPVWKRYYGQTGGGELFWSNRDSAYMRLQLSRSYGNLVVFRAKAPTFPDTSAGQPVTAPSQVRYWSICEYDLLTQRYVACSPDYRTPLDSQGDFTVVVSDPANRPANATAANGITWLPWGPYYDGMPFYRQMLPSADFTNTIADVPQGTDPQSVEGAYYPASAYCTKQRFEEGGWQACLPAGG